VPDSPSNWELARRLDRAETACERRAEAHVDRDLYTSERTSLREELTHLQQTVAGLGSELAAARREAEAAVKDLQDRQTATRRWMVTTAVAAASVLATVVLAVLA
jgi:uncharacterized protein YlxW (UPF0749 family)